MVDARNVRNIVLMRPVGSMIEFKQIIGRGTRLYDGKDHFTIYDFVKAHHHFSDPEWDGEPADPEPTKAAGDQGGAAPEPNDEPPTDTAPADAKPQKTVLKLADGKARTLQHMSATTFWSPDGKPISATQFLQTLFGALPEFFRDEDQLRALWSAPDTHCKLWEGLADNGFGKEPLAEMQKVIEAQSSDLFDVLAYVAFALAPQTRAERAAMAKTEVHQKFTDRQQAFVDFVLAQYVKEGVEELDAEKLTPLLRLRYNNAIADAVADLGSADHIRRVFVGFQKYLYEGRPN